MNTQRETERVRARLEEIDAQLCDPVSLKNPVLLRDLAAERAGLVRIAEVLGSLARTEAELEEMRGVLSGGDRELVQIAEEEIPGLENRRRELERRLRLLLLPRDPNDDRNVIVEIRSGTGGEEAALFAADVFRMYTAYAQKRGWSTEVLSSRGSERGGFREIVFSVKGEGAYSRLKYEAGVHRVQRVPETEAAGRIHTSACTVAVLPEAEEVEVDISPEDLRIDVFRATGPGGQSVNTTDSAVRITHIPTGTVVTCQDEKSQHKNKAQAMKVLRARLMARAREEQESERARARRGMVGSGDRSAKIRTYNFPQGRVTDHRIHLTVHALEEVMAGNLDTIVDALVSAEQERLLAERAQGVDGDAGNGEGSGT